MASAALPSSAGSVDEPLVLEQAEPLQMIKNSALRGMIFMCRSRGCSPSRSNRGGAPSDRVSAPGFLFREPGSPVPADVQLERRLDGPGRGAGDRITQI